MRKTNKEPDSRREVILNSGIVEFSTKSYNDASTDEITHRCSISKGLLFHYFGNKRELYFCCLEHALERLTSITPEVVAEDFFSILFFTMDMKLRLCSEFQNETRLVNMAAREMGKEVLEGKNRVFKKYLLQVKTRSAQTISQAVSKLKLKQPAQARQITEALYLYTEAFINRTLELYREKPDEFFAKRDEIQAELKQYLGYMLEGIVKED